MTIIRATDWLTDWLKKNKILINLLNDEATSSHSDSLDYHNPNYYCENEVEIACNMTNNSKSTRNTKVTLNQKITMETKAGVTDK